MGIISDRLNTLEKEIQELRDRVQETLEIINVVIDKIEKNMEKHNRVVQQLNKVTVIIEALAEESKIKGIDFQGLPPDYPQEEE